jgi:hypothetical protein
MPLTDAEVESLRFHLGYGNIDGVGASAYSPDGFLELFRDVVAPNLTGDVETTASTSASEGISSVTVADTTGIVAHARLLVDVGDAAELVTVRAVSGSAFTAAFTAEHAAPFPVALWGGHARLRRLLHFADTLWQAKQSSDVADVAGLKRIEGDVEWFPGGNTLEEREAAYQRVVLELWRLCQVEPRTFDKRTSQLEVY